MSVRIDAMRLSGADIGRKISIPEHPHLAEPRVITRIEHLPSVTVVYREGGGPFHRLSLPRDSEVTITGGDS